tara:strand:+ start:78621 stop:79076 length:456 start_codon:yes stop_codon:yes gene_type:complete
MSLRDKVRQLAPHYGDLAFITATGVLREPINYGLGLIHPDLGMDIGSLEGLHSTIDAIVRLALPLVYGLGHEIVQAGKNENDDLIASTAKGIGSSVARTVRTLSFYMISLDMPMSVNGVLMATSALMDYGRSNSPIREVPGYVKGKLTEII